MAFHRWSPERRRLMQAVAAMSGTLRRTGWAGLLALVRPLAAVAAGAGRIQTVARSDAQWPDRAQWDALRERVRGRLRELPSPWHACAADPAGAACHRLFRFPQNPYEIGDDPALTQTFGWVGAWMSAPSAWVVMAESAQDVAAAVDFAHTHRVRLVVKGGGHSYQGTSNAPDSLLIWTRRMHEVRMLDAFVPEGGAGRIPPVRAVSVGAGAMWSQVYDVVTTQHGGYVQGGGCMSVGAAGLVLSGGFGSFSKAFGTAAASLLEAEVVTAEGKIRIVNAVQDPDLYWALKGGGGGSFGVVTRMVLRVHPLPATFGSASFTVRASSDAAYRQLVAWFVDFCAARLINPHWGEQVRFNRANELKVAMVFQGIEGSEARSVWKPFFDRVEAAPNDFTVDFAPLKFIAIDARDFWAPGWMKRLLGVMRRDERDSAPDTNVFWSGDQAQAGQVINAYGSAWLPSQMLEEPRRADLAAALFDASRPGGFSLHFNKGLAGAPPEVIAAARDTATHPAVLDAFALLICADDAHPAHDGVPGHEPDLEDARQGRDWVGTTMQALRARIPITGSYLAEGDYFQDSWQSAFWGAHYERLLAIKRRYDPELVFRVHHGVGTEAVVPRVDGGRKGAAKGNAGEMVRGRLPPMVLP